MVGPAHKTKFEAGQRINNSFTLVRNFRRFAYYKHNRNYYEWLWECKCDCGNTFNARENKIESRRGCISCTHSQERLERTLRNTGMTNLSSKKRQFKDYQTGARKRGLSFELTFEEFVKLTESDCFYCGAKPEVHQRDLEHLPKWSEPWKRNGVDRLDTTKGYIRENCVPCCSKCNYAKHDLNLEDFKKWVKQIYIHMFIKGSTTIPKGSTPKQVEMGDSVFNNNADEDIVSSSLKNEAVQLDGCEVANHTEDNVTPLERATIEKETAIGVAQALANSNVSWVPSVMVGGSGSGSSAMDAVGLNMLLDIAKKMK